MLSLSISLPRASFGPAEQIELTAVLANTGSAPLLVNGRLALNDPTAPAAFRELALRISRAGGAALPFDARINLGAPREGNFRLLEPGQQVERSYELRNYYGLTPGSYTVEAVYENRQEFAREGQRAWQGEVGAHAITFEVGPAHPA